MNTFFKPTNEKVNFKPHGLVRLMLIISINFKLISSPAFDYKQIGCVTSMLYKRTYADYITVSGGGRRFLKIPNSLRAL